MPASTRRPLQFCLSHPLTSRRPALWADDPCFTNEAEAQRARATVEAVGPHGDCAEVARGVHAGPPPAGAGRRGSTSQVCRRAAGPVGTSVPVQRAVGAPGRVPGRGLAPASCSHDRRVTSCAKRLRRLNPFLPVEQTRGEARQGNGTAARCSAAGCSVWGGRGVCVPSRSRHAGDRRGGGGATRSCGSGRPRFSRWVPLSSPRAPGERVAGSAESPRWPSGRPRPHTPHACTLALSVR